MKRCPYCAEEIQDAAIVCKHCGRDLVPAAPKQTWEDEARALALKGDVIGAIKKVREASGMGLAEARRLVESWRQDPSAAPVQSTGSKGCALGCLGIVVLAVGLSVISSLVPKDPAQESRDNRIEAYVMCKQFVEKRLRAPKTAEFASFGQAVVQPLAGGDIEVTAHVDAQNGFGALIRNTFVCTVTPLPNDQWRLVDLKMN